MKKLLVLVLILSMLAVPVMSETIDLKTMSIEQLYELRAELEREIALRDGEEWGQAIRGDYLVGRDIEPGRYEVVVTFVVDGEKKCYVNVGKSKEDYDVFNLADHGSGPLGSRFSILLEEGNLMKVAFGDISLRPQTNKLFSK